MIFDRASQQRNGRVSHKGVIIHKKDVSEPREQRMRDSRIARFRQTNVFSHRDNFGRRKFFPH
jgi:hypothetical protein